MKPLELTMLPEVLRFWQPGVDARAVLAGHSVVQIAALAGLPLPAERALKRRHEAFRERVRTGTTLFGVRVDSELVSLSALSRASGRSVDLLARVARATGHAGVEPNKSATLTASTSKAIINLLSLTLDTNEACQALGVTPSMFGKIVKARLVDRYSTRAPIRGTMSEILPRSFSTVVTT